MLPPTDQTLPLFVYGALKPGLPAYEQLRDLVKSYSIDSVNGELYVRDGLPLLRLNGHDETEGFLLDWKPGHGYDGYKLVCDFEPRSHYQWKTIDLKSGCHANALVMRYENKGNPECLHVRSWKLQNDPAFGPGLDAVEKMLVEVDAMPKSSGYDPNFEKFFRSQMAYLLLWSILERLTAFCFGPSMDPMERIKKLHELPGMENLVKRHVGRVDKVSDSRDPDDSYRLNPSDAKKSFQYYYQVRSNLSHRGKGVFRDFEKVHGSLRELLAITRDFLKELSVTVE